MAALLLAACHRAPTSRLGAATGDASVPNPNAIVRYLDVTSTGALVAATRGLDARMDGGALPSFFPSGAPAPSAPQLHRTAPVWHCYQPGRAMLPMDARTALAWAAIKADCVAVLEAGVLDAGAPLCAAIVATPPLASALDATWLYDGGACWWMSEDAGGVPSPIPDLYDGSTP